jgi:hypothetical protein
VRMLLASLSLAIAISPVMAQSKSVDPKEYQAVVDKAYDFLKSRQKADGSFEPARGGPGTTALIATALLRSGKSPSDPVVAKALANLTEKNVQKDGGIYNGFIANYTTSIALVTLKEANADGKYDTIIANAAKFLKGIQQGGAEDQSAFGGYGYDAKTRPDVSNSHFTVEALLAAGVSKDDPAVKNAIIFLSRCQNLPSEANKFDFAKKASDDDKGGFVYNPFSTSKKDAPHKTESGGLRSEGGMTYAGLKSFLYAGVGKDDPRVKAALDWIRKHYTVKENPGKKDSGLYYYYNVFAKALTALGEDSFVDAKGEKHDWRKELFDELKSRQAADGSWTNKNGAFLENAPELATAFALLSLSYTK